MSSLRPDSILVVDDDASLRKVLRASLSMSGFAVEEACDGEEALARVQSYCFDLVLLDINMPASAQTGTKPIPNCMWFFNQCGDRKPSPPSIGVDPARG
jgi:CheY-like chemotaxis protein